MKIQDLAGKFIFTDPKQECLIQTHGEFEVIYKGRIEFLYNCGNSIEEYEVVNLEIGDHGEDVDSWISDILIITVKKGMVKIMENMNQNNRIYNHSTRILKGKYANYGIVGDVTPMTYENGVPMQVGDVVSIQYCNTKPCEVHSLVVMDGTYFIMGRRISGDNFINGINGNWKIKLIKKYYDLTFEDNYMGIQMINHQITPKPLKKIVVDGVEMEISDSGYDNLKKQLLSEM